jgi:hypothetical protein
MRRLIVRRVWIDLDSCLWHTLCRPEAPGLIEEVGSDGASRIKEESLLRTQDELKQLLEASQVCPMNAFYVETDSGEVLNIGELDWVQKAIQSGSYAWEKK